jgi:hypothetical protein
MTSLFEEFSMSYARFKEEFPNHPLTDELRTSIVRRRFPHEQWLRSQIKRMNDILEPSWSRDNHAESHKECA